MFDLIMPSINVTGQLSLKFNLRLRQVVTLITGKKGGRNFKNTVKDSNSRFYIELSECMSTVESIEK